MKYEKRRIDGFSRYMVDTEGIIYRQDGKPMMPKVHYKKGYCSVALTNDFGIRKTVSIHQIVARTFVDGYAPNLEVNHKNKNRQDNRAENLEWVTHTENVRYSRGKHLIVETKSGVKLYYSVTADFERDIGWSSGRVMQYLKLHDGYFKKLGLRFYRS